MKSTKIMLVLIIISSVLTSCGVSVKGSCSGNKTMTYYGGYSRKPFNK